MKLKKIAALLAVAGMSAPAFATNGMNMEGYGPVATGMGGASFAYDNGTAGMINNPATLGFMKSGTSRLDVAIGGLHPWIDESQTGASVESDGTAYFMPAIGYVRKDGKLTYGIGMMAQGGMGTEFGTNSFLSNHTSMTGVGGTYVSGMEQRSELGIGRILFPISFDVSDTFKVGGSIDYLWGGLDLNMGLGGNQFRDLLTPGSARGSASGTMVGGLMNLMNDDLEGGCDGTANLGFGLGNCINDMNWAHFSFSKGKNSMTQAATTTGWAGNLGFVWQASPKLTVGGVYHGKTSLKDMEGNATVTMNVKVGAFAGGPGTGADTPMAVNGKIKIVNFQWPETYGIGMAYQANDNLTLVADYKRIGWKKVMDAFRMQFIGVGGQFDGAVMDAQLNQNWKDQNVFMVGAAYKVSAPLTVRFGANIANNPVPDNVLNPLFPAIIKNHLTGGFGYAFDKKSSLDFSFAYAPEVSATNADGVKVNHSQTNWQLMYSNRF